MSTARWQRLATSRWTAVVLCALLVFFYARGAWPLGFIALVPWLHSLAREQRMGGTLCSAWAMSVAYTAAGFGWLAGAIGSYTGVGTPAALAVLLIAAPLFQPQFFAFVLAWRAAAHAPALLRAAVAAAAWVACEGLVPRLLDDSFGYGLYPSAALRQAADLGSVAGLTLMLLAVNEALARALASRGAGVRAVALPLAAALAVPLLLAAYGLAVLAQPPEGGPSLRVGLVQSNITDYERLRREKGAGAVVREVLDTHYAMSYDAVERQHVDAVLWSETVYPTTFGHPKSEAGAELDREIAQIVNAAGVPFVFGTYDRDAGGEYNAAAFVTPGNTPVAFYRKSRPFPITEYVPPWLDGAAFRGRFPWAGSWQPGNGARVLPLRTRDGREVPVLPLICLDDVDVQLAVDGARLGAQAILTMSNDAWFTGDPLGAQLHLAAAAFRSIETRLPQFRVTTNGLSAVIEASGRVVAGSRMGERTLVIGELPVHEPPSTLVVRWGDWVPRAAAAFLLAVAALALLRRISRRRPQSAALARAALPARVAVLPPWARVAASALRAVAGAGLLAIGVGVLLGEGAWASNTLAQVRSFAIFVLAPEAAAWLLVSAFAATLRMEGGELVMARGTHRVAFAASAVAGLEPWRVPLPTAGASLRLANGGHQHIALRNPRALEQALHDAGAPLPATSTPAWTFADARAASPRGWLMHPAVKFILLPLLLAIPAFRLHQHIAYGSSLGELYTFGAAAFLKGFVLWWAGWAVAVVLWAAALRAIVEALTFGAASLRPPSAIEWRRGLEYAALGFLYLGLPAWLALRLLAG